MANKRTDLHPGHKVGFLRLLRRVNAPKDASPATKTRWRVRCEARLHLDGDRECGRELTVPQWYITRKQPKTHCGCQTETLKSRYAYEYHCWAMMRTRCNYEGHIAYKDYGGRGIKVCAEWDTLDGGFERWFAHIGPAPTRKHTQDRINNDEGYYPGNVRWATPSEQRANQRPRKG